jgi:Flp pilus assembly pilin Flp
MFHSFASRPRRFLSQEEGLSTVEYGAIIALVLAACISAQVLLGLNAGGVFGGAAGPDSSAVAASNP